MWCEVDVWSVRCVVSGVVCVQEDANARIHNVHHIFSFFSVEISELKDRYFFFFV